MTSPTPAPNGFLASGLPAPSIEVARDDMLNTFEDKRQPLADNTAYFESSRRPTAIGIATPVKMQALLANIGYPRLYINAIADRLTLEGFRLGGADAADDELWKWWQSNDLDVEAPLGYIDTLTHGRSYITVAAPDPLVDIDRDPTIPIIRVESPYNLYAQIDPRTRSVTQAIRAVYSDDGSSVIAATVYLPLLTAPFIKDQGQWVPQPVIAHNLGIVPVIPVPNRIQGSDLYGTSEITPELKSITDAASRIMMNMQATAELMAVPQRLLFGIKPEELGVDPATGQSSFDAYLARILAFEDHEAKAQQFSAAELRNFTDALQECAKQAAAWTGLPPQYLSTASDNPASAEAIKASESRLVTNCERKAIIIGGAWEQAMRIAKKVMNPGAPIPPNMFQMESIWSDPSTPTFAAKADAVSKLYANGLGVIPKERARIDLGYSVTERLEMQKWDEQENPLGTLGAIMSPGAAAPADGPTASAAKPTSTVTASAQT